ncbi:hypothetical protein E3J85_02575 [Patescibacteria group bacterium]|nr:MAG: hypothetical protein E3J85_02575 [Patescibacteria group bacterium]
MQGTLTALTSREEELLKRLEEIVNDCVVHQGESVDPSLEPAYIEVHHWYHSCTVKVKKALEYWREIYSIINEIERIEGATTSSFITSMLRPQDDPKFRDYRWLESPLYCVGRAGGLWR